MMFANAFNYFIHNYSQENFTSVNHEFSISANDSSVNILEIIPKILSIPLVHKDDTDSSEDIKTDGEQISPIQEESSSNKAVIFTSLSNVVASVAASTSMSMVVDMNPISAVDGASSSIISSVVMTIDHSEPSEVPNASEPAQSSNNSNSNDNTSIARSEIMPSPEISANTSAIAVPAILTAVQQRSSERHAIHPEFASTTASNNASRNITIDELRKYFHLPIAEVAKKLGTCTTALKKFCRKLNIIKWPCRQILSLTKSIQSLEIASLSDHLEDSLRRQYQQQIALLHKVIGEVIRNPNKTIEHCNLTNLTNEIANEVFSKSDELRSENAGVVLNAPKDPAVSSSFNPSAIIGSATIAEGPFAKISPMENLVSSDPFAKQGTACMHSSVIDVEEEVHRMIRQATEPIAVPNAGLKFLQHQQQQQVNGKKRKYSTSVAGIEDAELAYLRQSVATSSQSHTAAKQASSPSLTGSSLSNIMNNCANIQQLQLSHPSNPDLTNASNAINNSNSTVNPGQKPNLHSTRYSSIDIGSSVVKVHYFEDKTDHWAFFGPVQLPPLQRKKFKPLASNPNSLSNNSSSNLTSSASRKNVPLMEPDVGSNTSIDFVPLTLVNAFKKSITEHSAAAFATHLMMYDPLTGAFMGHINPSQSASVLSSVSNESLSHNNTNSNTSANTNPALYSSLMTSYARSVHGTNLMAHPVRARNGNSTQTAATAGIRGTTTDVSHDAQLFGNHLSASPPVLHRSASNDAALAAGHHRLANPNNRNHLNNMHISHSNNNYKFLSSSSQLHAPGLNDQHSMSQYQGSTVPQQQQQSGSYLGPATSQNSIFGPNTMAQAIHKQASAYHTMKSQLPHTDLHVSALLSVSTQLQSHHHHPHHNHHPQQQHPQHHHYHHHNLHPSQHSTHHLVEGKPFHAIQPSLPGFQHHLPPAVNYSSSHCQREDEHSLDASILTATEDTTHHLKSNFVQYNYHTLQSHNHRDHQNQHNFTRVGHLAGVEHENEEVEEDDDDDDRGTVMALSALLSPIRAAPTSSTSLAGRQNAYIPFLPHSIHEEQEDVIDNIGTRRTLPDADGMHNDSDHVHKKPQLHAFSPIQSEPQQQPMHAAVSTIILPVLKHEEENSHKSAVEDRQLRARSRHLGSFSPTSSAPTTATPIRNEHKMELMNKTIASEVAIAETVVSEAQRQHQNQLEDHEQQELMRQWMDGDYEEETVADHVAEYVEAVPNGEKEMSDSLSRHHQMVLAHSQ